MVFEPVDININPLFRGDPSDTELNACVGMNGGPYGLSHYAEGFFEAAKLNVEAVKQRQTYYVDVLVYPVAFAYRHGIELYLKQFLIYLKKLSGNDAKTRKGHDLLYYWECCVAEITNIGDFEFPKELLKEMGDTITYFCDLDPSGQVFRYPEDIKGNKHISGFNLISLGVLSEHMEALKDNLSNALDWSAIQLEWKREAESEQ